MSLWRRERLRLVLTPEQTWALHRHPNGKDQAEQRQFDPIESLDGSEAVTAYLSEPRWRNTEVDILVSNRWVAYTLSEPPGALLNPVEENALALARTCAVYGGNAADWCVSVQSQPPDAGVFAAAMRVARIETIQSVLDAAGVKRYQLRPLLDAAATQKLRKSRGWWVVVEPGMACLLKMERGAWRHVACHPCANDWPTQLARHLHRAHDLAGESDGGSPVWFQPIGCTVTGSPTVPEGWTSHLVLPAGAAMWDWDRI